MKEILANPVFILAGVWVIGIIVMLIGKIMGWDKPKK